MRGVVIFMTALFLLAPYYLIMTMAIEPLIDFVLGFGTDMSGVSGQSTINTLEGILFVYGPFIYVASWFVWAIRYYYSRSRYVGQVGQP